MTSEEYKSILDQRHDDLRRFIKCNRINYRELCERAGFSLSKIYVYLSRKSIPESSLLRLEKVAVEIATEAELERAAHLEQLKSKVFSNHTLANG